MSMLKSLIGFCLQQGQTGVNTSSHEPEPNYLFARGDVSPEVKSTSSPIRPVGTISNSNGATVGRHGDVVTSDNVSTCCGVGGCGTADRGDDTRGYLGGTADGRIDGGCSGALDSSSDSPRRRLCWEGRQVGCKLTFGGDETAPSVLTEAVTAPALALASAA
jgi:hypothetical protein